MYISSHCSSPLTARCVLGKLLVAAAHCCTWDLLFYRKMINWIKFSIKGKRELTSSFLNFDIPNLFQVPFDIKKILFSILKEL